MSNRKGQIITSSSLINKETGEIISGYERILELPKKFMFNVSFIKITDRAINEIDSLNLGYFTKLANYLEYETNRYTQRHVGMTPKPLKQKHFSSILGISERTTGTFIRKMKKMNAIFYFDKFYFCNPTFACRSKFIFKEIFEKMLSIDSRIINYIDEKQKSILKKVLRTRLVS